MKPLGKRTPSRRPLKAFGADHLLTRHHPASFAHQSLG
jgi:hypothetical protein